MYHTKDQECPGCKDKLVEVHMALADWFWEMKWSHPDIHISQGWRGEEDQNADYQAGKSRAMWGQSKHNNILNGQPCSLALDIFSMDAQGKAHWDEKLFSQIAEETKNAGYPIIWGGDFTTIHDADHYELKQ